MTNHKYFPFQINSYGHIETADDDAHIRQMMEQILFTIPGERVNRPHFGCGVQMMVFGSTQPELLAVKQSMIETELQQYLGHLVRLEAVQITQKESRVSVLIRYTVLNHNQSHEAVFTR